MTVFTDPNNLRKRLTIVEDLYSQAQTLIPGLARLDTRVPSRSQESIQRFTSILLPRLSGLTPRPETTPEQHLAAIKEVWDVKGHILAKSAELKNRKQATSLANKLATAVIELASDLKETRDSLDQISAHIQTGPPRTQPQRGARLRNGITTRQATAEELAAAHTPRNTGARATGPSHSSSRIPTYIQGNYVRTNGQGELEFLIESAFRKLDTTIDNMAQAAQEYADSSRREHAYDAYLALIDRSDRGLDINGLLPTLNEFMDKVETDRVSQFSYEKVALEVLTIRDAIEDETMHKLGVLLEHKQLVDITLDLSVHAHHTLSSHLHDTHVTDNLAYAIHEAMRNDQRHGDVVELSALRRVMADYPRRAHSNPKISFSSAMQGR